MNLSFIFLGDKDASSLVNGIDDEDRLIKPLKGTTNHEGYLYKQANSLYKGWRLSFFVIEDRQTVCIQILCFRNLYNYLAGSV